MRFLFIWTANFSAAFAAIKVLEGVSLLLCELDGIGKGGRRLVAGLHARTHQARAFDARRDEAARELVGALEGGERLAVDRPFRPFVLELRHADPALVDAAELQPRRRVVGIEFRRLQRGGEGSLGVVPVEEEFGLRDVDQRGFGVGRERGVDHLFGLVRPTGDEQHLREAHRDVDLAGIEANGLAEIVDRVEVAPAQKQIAQLLVGGGALRVDLQRTAVLEDRVFGLAGLREVLGSFDVLRETLFGGRAGDEHADREGGRAPTTTGSLATSRGSYGSSLASSRRASSASSNPSASSADFSISRARSVSPAIASAVPRR